ncbi:hypothetical protein ACQP1O_19865 [Nocardia sp. CA-151230]|uniref:hypothetical protein n=1 Tax=Nocardia sp. CA-151230 TaxID=3239982 RepID=UPI003D89E0FD
MTSTTHAASVHGGRVAADVQRRSYLFLRLSLWSVVLYAGLGLLGFAVVAGFWPPPAEGLTATEIAAYFSSHGSGVRIGMVLMVVGAPWYYVWSIAVSKVIGRIEGQMGPLSMMELLGGFFTAVITAAPGVIWLTAAFRPESRSAENIQLFYDLGWLTFDMTFVFSFIQSIAIGIAILIDSRPEPLFPRWVAWLSFLTAATYVPLTIMPFVRTGPFAWNGLLNFWAVFVLFFVLIAAVTPTGLRALRRLEHEDRDVAAS